MPDVYPSKTVTVTADVTSTAGLPEITVPVRWELDGQMVSAAPQTVTLTNGYGQVSFDWAAPLDGRQELTVYIGSDDPIELTADLRVA